MFKRTKLAIGALALTVAGTGALALANDEGGHHYHGRGPASGAACGRWT
jgi:hypothetical protein